MEDMNGRDIMFWLWVQFILALLVVFLGAAALFVAVYTADWRWLLLTLPAYVVIRKF